MSLEELKAELQVEISKPLKQRNFNRMIKLEILIQEYNIKK